MQTIKARTFDARFLVHTTHTIAGGSVPAVESHRWPHAFATSERALKRAILARHPNATEVAIVATGTANVDPCVRVYGRREVAL